MKKTIVSTPIEKYHMMQFDIHDYITTHEGVKGELVNILNKAGTSFFNSLLNKADPTESRPVKRVKLTINIGVAMRNNVFKSYLGSIAENPKIAFSDLDTDSPFISISGSKHSITSFGLDIISDIKIESETIIERFDRYTITYHNNLNNLDYRMTIVIDK